jgi:hypothetical protein
MVSVQCIIINSEQGGVLVTAGINENNDLDTEGSNRGAVKLLKYNIFSVCCGYISII